MKRHTLLAVLVLLGFGGWTRADDPKAFKVPFDTIKSQHIVVMVKINGQGPYRMIFDTGAPFTFIGSRCAKDSGVIAKDAKMGGLPLFKIPEFNIKNLELGDLKVKDFTTAVLDHPTVSAIEKAVGNVDGLIGMSFFGKYRFTIDYKAKEMTFVPVDFTPRDIKNLSAMLLSSDGEKKVWAPAGLWGFSVAKEAKDEDAGVVVNKVLEGSAASKAGLKAGDRLLTLDGRWTDSVADCYLAASFVRPGQHAVLVIRRDGKDMEIKVSVQSGL
jgi:hypothetical protein